MRTAIVFTVCIAATLYVVRLNLSIGEQTMGTIHALTSVALVAAIVLDAFAIWAKKGKQ